MVSLRCVEGLGCEGFRLKGSSGVKAVKIYALKPKALNTRKYN